LVHLRDKVAQATRIQVIPAADPLPFEISLQMRQVAPVGGHCMRGKLPLHTKLAQPAFDIFSKHSLTLLSHWQGRGVG